MNVSEFVTNLTQQGVQLWADNDKLKINSPKGVLTPQLQTYIATYKTEILSFLRKDNDISNSTYTELSLQTIGRLIGGYCERLSMQFKSPIIDSKVMAKQLRVTFRPLQKGFKNETILQFRKELELQLQNHGVKVVAWEEATREFSYEIPIPLVKWKKKMMLMQ